MADPDDVDEHAPAPGSDRALFVVAIFASAFLIFLVQPMVGKRILPWFGGAPAVWSLCLAFYQTTLFAGYAYAHALIRFAPPGAQLGIHAALLAAALAGGSVLPGDAWQPSGVGRPSSDILAMLGASVALPFLALAATGPLVQAWFAARHPTRSPYPLYAVSNAGSFGALVAYPFVLEPRFGLAATGEAWTLAFAATGVAVLACAALAWRAARGRDASANDAPGGARDAAADPAAATGPLRAAAWLAFPGVAVVVLMGVTNKVCLDVASVPFLWVLPLGAYLLSFVVSFSSARAYRRAPTVAVALGAFALTVALPAWRDAAGLTPGHALLAVSFQIPAYCVLLFATCMVLHGELYRLRPAPARLTAFYLFVSAGGALGGLGVGLLAPAIFDDYYELPIGLVAAAALLLGACAVDPRSALHRDRPRWRWAIVAPAFALALGLLGAGLGPAHTREDVVHQERTFFGLLRVDELDRGELVERDLTSGSTLHGVQLFGASLDRAPTSYYGRATALGMLLAARRPDAPRRVGVIGLGVGTLAAYGRPGDLFRFYEIDPAVLRIAREDGYFSFLADSEARVEVVVGDARLALADELRGGARPAYDWLVLDAFSSDAIPVHLLTREAFAIYEAALAEGGVLALHISNRHFDLMPQVARQGFEVGLHGLQASTRAVSSFQSQRSIWIFMTRSDAERNDLIDRLRRRRAAMGLPPRHLELIGILPEEVADVVPWSDDYSDLLGSLRAKPLPEGW